ncbi:alpha-xenorhabdolysin family binary toxin subunit A [Nocardiopsis potens]|uniref:alpha-xenorhabdolysin family binary toxin subunit A n=1 Tax=Nocardiopsis potens TaxID=1246458 RepID=UPI00034D55CC|nr:alpha-xenorhabdolysin family binary toxin subunit A [Nocardiopsis potens]
MGTEPDIKGQADKLRGPNHVDGKKRFLLTEAEWRNVQVYCTTVQALPTTDDMIKIKLALTTEDNVADFKDLRDQYKTMYDHVKFWDDTAMPRSIKLATDINNYGRNANLYYGEMLRLAKEGLSDPARKKRFLEIVEDRAKKADDFAKDAKEVSGLITEFHKTTDEDAKKMGDLKVKYDKKYDSDNAEWKKLKEQIEKDQKDLGALNDQYNHEVTVAATTPSYAWVTVFGFIAAVTVAAVYTDKALKTKAAIEALEKKIGDAQKKLTRNAHILKSAKYAKDSVDDTKKNVDLALDTLGKMRSGWESIAVSMRSLADLVGTDIKKAEALVDLQVQQAINDWTAIADDAKGYINSAYIKKPSYAELQLAA